MMFRTSPKTTDSNQTVDSAVARGLRGVEVFELQVRPVHARGKRAAEVGPRASRARLGVGTDHSVVTDVAVLLVTSVPAHATRLAIRPQARLLVHDEVARLHLLVLHALLRGAGLSADARPAAAGRSQDM